MAPGNLPERRPHGPLEGRALGGQGQLEALALAGEVLRELGARRAQHGQGVVGRGREGARALDPARARALFDAVFEGRIGELELGGVLIALRMKGESVDEIEGSGSGWTFAKLTIANATIRDLAVSAAQQG